MPALFWGRREAGVRQLCLNRERKNNRICRAAVFLGNLFGPQCFHESLAHVWSFVFFGFFYGGSRDWTLALHMLNTHSVTELHPPSLFTESLTKSTWKVVALVWSNDLMCSVTPHIWHMHTLSGKWSLTPQTAKLWGFLPSWIGDLSRGNWVELSVQILTLSLTGCKTLSMSSHSWSLLPGWQREWWHTQIYITVSLW
jgi:hypothetical protein